MKKILALLVLGAFVAQTQADLTIGASDIWVNAGTNNTALADGSGDDWTDDYGGWGTADDNGLWNRRTGFGYDDSGVLNGDIYSAYGNTFGQLKTTASGLVDGQQYAVYVVYSSKSSSENWNVTADLNPISLSGTSNLVASGTTYGAADGTLLGVTVNAGADADDDGGGIFSFKGFVANYTGTSSGTLDIYIDDLADTTGANERAWYDGVYLEAIPEPATIGLFGIFGAGVLFIRRHIKII